MGVRQMYSLAMSTVIVALTAVAADAQDNVARTYSIVPKAGMAAQFEVALEAHIEWRAENDDPWTWSVTTVETGDGVGSYGVRSSGHTWADFDTYDADFGRDALVHFNATVSPLVESVSSRISTIDEEISHRPGADRPLAFVNITRFHIRPDRQAEFNEAIGLASRALIERDWPGYWVWEVPISGGGMGPFIDVVGLHDSWADMQELDPSMLEALAQSLGNNDFEDWETAFSGSIRGQETITRRLRPDLTAN